MVAPLTEPRVAAFVLWPAQQLRQLGDIRRDPVRFIAREQFRRQLTRPRSSVRQFFGEQYFFHVASAIAPVCCARTGGQYPAAEFIPLHAACVSLLTASTKIA
jgi:hypothetical protein